jgi:hypothetical protein
VFLKLLDIFLTTSRKAQPMMPSDEPRRHKMAAERKKGGMVRKARVKRAF